MTSRARSDLLLVGSLPADSTETALRSAAGFFGHMVFAVPDGETGARAGWITYELDELIRPHTDIETVQEPESPNGVVRHAYETPVCRIRSGVTKLHWATWPRIDDAIASYQQFCALRRKGVIPEHVRFQVGLPFPSSALSWWFTQNFTSDYPVAEQGYEALVGRELERLTKGIPPEDLAIQWDVCYEVLDIEGVFAWTPDGAWERFTGPVARLSRLIPEEVPVGYHLCYGTFPEWPMYEARDMSLIVKMANHAAAYSGRTVDWFHLAGPRHLRSEEDNFFRPLADLDTGDARIYLGIVQPIDGVPGLKRRQTTAAKYLTDFGVAMYCGFGRQPGEDGEETMREHQRIVQAATG